MKNYFWNMIASIKNGQLAKRPFIHHKKKIISIALLQILWKEGFILGYQIPQDQTDKIKIFLKYKNNKPVITYIKLISKPSRRIYYSLKQIWKINYTEACIIFSTNKGLKTLQDCKKLYIGGEPMMLIY